MATASAVHSGTSSQPPGHSLGPVTRPNMVSVGTIVWLSSELMFFAGLFAMYFTLRSMVPEVFAAGVRRSGEPGGLLHHLFGVRTLSLFDRLAPAQAPAPEGAEPPRERR